MGEYASRGPSYQTSTSAATSAPSAPAATPADKARDAVGSTKRELATAKRDAAELTAAHDANDPARWARAKHELETAIERSARTFGRARACERDAPPEVKAELDQARRELEEATAAAHAAEPPKGFVAVAGELELAQAVRDADQHRIQHALEDLTIAELRILRDRIASPKPADALAAAAWALGPERRRALTDFIHTVDRRKARERAAAVRPPRPMVAPEPETVDTRLRRAFEAPDVEVALHVVIAAEENTVRRAIAERLRRYRPGSGDDIGAHFSRLDAGMRERIFGELAREKLRDAVHAQPTGFPQAPAPIIRVEPARVPEPDPRDPMRAFRETRIETRETWADDDRHGTSRAAVIKYIAQHAPQIWAAVHETITAAHWAGVPTRATIDEVQFNAVVVAELREATGDFTNGRIAELVYPEDVFAALSSVVPTGDGWNAAVATIMVQHLQRSLAPSVRRMTERFVAASDEVPLARPAELASRLAYTRPIDRIVAHALSIHISIAAGARKPGARALLRPVMLHWQGSTDPRMWNVVRAVPGDATVEEVAAALAPATAHGNASDQSYLIAAAPPLFVIPAAWALHIPEARGHAPLALRRGPVDVGDDSVDARMIQLASSSAADELARDQQKTTKPMAGATPAAIDRALDETLILLEDLHALLTPWELAAGVTAETIWVASKRMALQHANASAVAEWSPIALAQQQRLSVIIGLAHQTDRAATQLSADRRADAVARQRSILALLATAAATSHLAQTSEAALGDAIAEARKGALAGFDTTAMTLDEAMGAARDRLDREGPNGPKDENGDVVRDTQSREQWGPYTELRDQAADIQRRAAAGEQVEPQELARVEVSMRETNMKQRLHAMQLTLDELQTAQILAAEGVVSHVVSTSSFRSLRGAIEFLHTSIGVIFKDLNDDAKALPARPSMVGDDVAIREQAVTQAEHRFTALSTEHHLGDFLQHAAEVIEHQQTRTMIVKLGVMIAASIAISAVSGGAGFALMGDSIASTVGALAIEAVGNGTVQYLTSAGERNATSYGGALVENAFYAGANRFVVGPAFAKAGAILGGTGEALERQIAQLQIQETRLELAINRLDKVIEWTAKESAVVSAHAISGMALGAIYAHARAAAGGPAASAQTVEDFELQAVSVSVAKHVHLAISARLPRYRAMAQLSPGGKQMLEAGAQLEAQMRGPSEKANAAAALKGLDDLLRITERELAELETLASPRGPSPEQRAELHSELVKQRAELRGRDMLELRWRVLGLRQLSTEIWTGTAADLDHGLSQAHALGMMVEIVDQTVEVTRVRIDGAAIALHVVGASPRVAGTHGGAEKPAETAWGHVWPGEVPSIAPPEVRTVFEQARRIYESFKTDRFQGGTAGRMQWTRYLVGHGIQVDGVVRVGGEHEVHEIARPIEPKASTTAISDVPEMDSRSGNTGGVTLARCEAALDELVASGGMLEKARRVGKQLEVRLADGRSWHVELAPPRRMAEHRMADLEAHRNGDVVWVSDRLTDEQVPRALGAIIGKALQSVGYARATADAGALEAMFAHREAAASQKLATTGDIKARAIANSKLENVARIDAEIDLAMYRMGLLDGDHEARLAALPPSLATKVRTQLEHHAAIGVDVSAVLADAAITGPRATKAPGLATSKVLPDAPAAVHAYTSADYEHVLALRAEFEILKEIDTRIAHRDQPGTNSTPDIAKGETERRAQHVARARALMAELQLGGNDRSYLEGRLQELARVFPGAERELVPAIESRIQRRANAGAIHGRAEAFRTARVKLVAELVAQVTRAQPFTTDRVVVGAGVGAVADVATLGVGKSGNAIDPARLLVIGGGDLMDRIDPAFLWGQRAAAYDRPTKSHPAFSDARGAGDGSLVDAVEDPGEFMHVGELRDALDVTREKLGMIALPGEVHAVETFADKRADSPAWEVSSEEYPVRIRYKLGADGAEHVVYAKRTDITPGPGNPNYPSAKILGTADRDTMIENHTLYSGDRLLEGRAVGGKRVLVVAFGPTGAWTARTASDLGAARVDWGSLEGGELGAGADDKPPLQNWHRGMKRENTPSADLVYNNTMEIDRVQSARDPKANIHMTLDRIVHIERTGEGAVVTFAHGPAENVELYTVQYDVIITSMGYTSRSMNAPNESRPTWATPSAQDMIGGIAMEPARGTTAPVTADKATGRVRVLGISAGEAINVSSKSANNTPSDAAKFAARRTVVSGRTSADSPDDRVVEGVGQAIREANEDDQ